MPILNLWSGAFSPLPCAPAFCSSYYPAIYDNSRNKGRRRKETIAKYTASNKILSLILVPTSINKTFSCAPRLSPFVDAREIFTNCPLAANPRERCKNGRKHGVIKMSRSVHRRGGDIGIPSEGFSLPLPCKGRRKARTEDAGHEIGA